MCKWLDLGGLIMCGWYNWCVSVCVCICLCCLYEQHTVNSPYPPNPSSGTHGAAGRRAAPGWAGFVHLACEQQRQCAVYIISIHSALSGNKQREGIKITRRKQLLITFIIPVCLPFLSFVAEQRLQDPRPRPVCIGRRQEAGLLVGGGGALGHAGGGVGPVGVQAGLAGVQDRLEQQGELLQRNVY